MNELPRFIRIGDDRINVDEISSYGLGMDWDDDEEEYRYLYVQTKSNDDLFQYNEGDEDVDFDIDEKIAELDELFLLRKLGRVDFQGR